MSIVPDGALVDSRPASRREKDYVTREVAGSHHVIPFRNKKITKLTATVYSQEYTSSCVPHAFYTQLEYEKLTKGKALSQLLAYRKRENYPNPGSIAADMYERIKEGQHRNAVAPVKPGHREKEANELPYLKGESMITDFIYFTYKSEDYHTIPNDISQGKAVAIFIFASKEEWSKEYVEPTDPNVTLNNAYVRHAVCLVPSGDFKENEKEWLTVHDSAGFGGRHLRYISKEFLQKRAYYGSRVYSATAIPNPQPPVVTLPTEPCKFQDESRAVRNLQSYLIEKGYLDSIYQTGYFGNLTAKALLEWQLVNYAKFNFVRPVRELLSLEGKFYGEQSIAIVKGEV